jgi:hypothetical protein
MDIRDEQTEWFHEYNRLNSAVQTHRKESILNKSFLPLLPSEDPCSLH